jgi:hypothetical protein
MKKLFVALLLLSTTLTFLSCKSDNEEDLFLGNECNTEGVSYGDFVAPQMAASCNSCHGSGTIITTNHTNLRTIALNGKLMGSINHETGYLPMPQGQPKLEQCTRQKLGAWVSDGAPDN